MTGTSSRLGDVLHQVNPVGPRQHQVQQDQVGLILLHEAQRLRRVGGHHRFVARPHEGVADVPERLGVVVHSQDAQLFRAPRSAGRGPTGGGRGDVPSLLHRRKGEGEPCAQARPVALGPDAAPERFNYSLADGKAQARVAPLFLGLYPGELAEQVRQALGGDASALVGYRHRDVDPLPTAVTRMMDDSDECLDALIIRLPSTCTMRSLSAMTQGRSGARSISMLCLPPPLRKPLRASLISMPTSVGSGKTASVPVSMRATSSRSLISTCIRSTCALMIW